MLDLITGFSVAGDDPVLFSTVKIHSLKPGSRLALRLSGERHCTGYDDPAGNVFSCPDDAPASRGQQCGRCAESSKRLPCLRCTGAVCANPARRAKCVFSDHFVYLALYAEDLIKVGITRAERLPARLKEQGALAGVAITAAGGQEVRRVEADIGRLGWVDRVNVLPLLGAGAPWPVSPQAAHRQLADELEKVRLRLPDLVFMDDGPFVWHADAYPRPHAIAPRLLDPSTDPVAGEIIGIRGNYLILLAAGQPVACSFRSMMGREIVTDCETAEGPAQAALAF